MQLLVVFISIFSVANCHVINTFNTGWNNIVGNNMLGLGNTMLGTNNMLGMNNMWNNNMWGNNMMSRQLISGRFVMRLMPGDSMFMDRYLALWGVDAEMADAMKDSSPPLEIMIDEDGDEMTMTYIMPDGNNWASTMKFGQMGTMMNPMIGKEQSCTVYMTSPNSFTIETMVTEDALQDIKTFTFNAMGVQVRAWSNMLLNKPRKSITTKWSTCVWLKVA